MQFHTKINEQKEQKHMEKLNDYYTEEKKWKETIKFKKKNKAVWKRYNITLDGLRLFQKDYNKNLLKQNIFLLFHSWYFVEWQDKGRNYRPWDQGGNFRFASQLDEVSFASIFLIVNALSIKILANCNDGSGSALFI